MAFVDPSQLELEDRLVAINRITKVVKGGRRMRFAAIVVVGDKNGHVGLGTGEAIRKGVDNAQKNLIEVPKVGTTIPHEIIGEFGAGRVLLKPAVAGSGIAAGDSVRAVMELAGIDDITTKSLGRNTPINMIRATIDGLSKLKTSQEIAALRGISIEDLQG